MDATKEDATKEDATKKHASHRGAMSTLQSVPVQFLAPFPLVQTVLFPLGFVKQGNWQSSITKAHRLEKSHFTKRYEFSEKLQTAPNAPPALFLDKSDGIRCSTVVL